MTSSAPVTAAAAAAATTTTYFPPELIPEVARRLTSLQDFFALRASCRAYRAALPLTPSNLASQAPLLLLVPGRDDQATESPALYHPSMRRLLRFRLPPPRRAQYISLGCRVIICDLLTDPNCEEYRMVHLLTGEQTRLPSPEGDPIAFILFGDLLLTWSYDSSTIQSYRLGAADWSVTSFWDYNLQGVVCVNGTIYAMVSSYLSDSPVYRLAVVELSDNRRNSAELVFLGSLHTQTLELPVDTELLLYPAECHGELILIVAIEYNPRQYPRVFRAFKWKSGEDEWVRITSLGGCVLFFSDSDFVGFLGPDHPGIQKDCIYFNKKGLWSEYSSVDGSFHQSDAVCPEGKLLDTFREESVWVFPSMY